jgi:hypothetical protein
MSNNGAHLECDLQLLAKARLWEGGPHEETRSRTALGPADTPTGGLERPKDRGVLGVLEGWDVTRCACRAGSVMGSERFGNLHHRSAGEDTGTLEDVL